MSVKAIFSLVFCVSCVAAAQVLLKSRLVAYGPPPGNGDFPAYLLMLVRDPLVWAVAVLTVLGAAGWYYGLSLIDLSKAIVFIALLYPAIAVSGYFFLGESLTLTKVIGVSLVCIGVVLTTWS
jgi:drug/metabolite transporter (DMT)-like permease